MQESLTVRPIAFDSINRRHNVWGKNKMIRRVAGMFLLGIVLTGCATMSETPKQDIANNPLYDGASPNTFESIFTADENVDYIALGDAELASGEPDKALFAYLKALQGEADQAATYFKIGSIHRNRQNSQLAEVAFKKVVDLNPDHTSALQALGLIKLQARQYSQAEKYFYASIKADEKRFIGVEENEVIPTVSAEEVIRIKADITTLKQDLRVTLKYRSELYGQMDSLKKGEDYQSSYDPKIADLNEQLKTLSDDFTGDHPEVVFIKSQLTQLEAKRDQERSLAYSNIVQEQASGIEEQLTQTNDKATEIGSRLRAKQQELLNAEAVIMQKKAVKP